MRNTIEMALEAGFVENAGNVYGGHVNLKAFEALVRADEHETCAKVCEEEICDCCWDDDAQAAAEHLAAAIRARGETK